MDIAIPLFDRFTALDAIGPYEVLSRIPGVELRFVAREPGVKRTDTGALGMEADLALGDLPDPDVLLVPGGQGNRPLLEDDEVLDWLRAVHEGTTWTTSVCTGSLVLGAAGLLKGYRAATHWTAMDSLSSFGAIPTKTRVCTDRNRVTGGGVTAGIDFALTLVSMLVDRPTAEAIQLRLEYNPAPPFNSGSPDTAAPETLTRFNERSAPFKARRQEAVARAAARLSESA